MATERPLDEAPQSAGAALTASPERADEIFLEGPRSRFDEFITLLRVMRDFLRGFRTLHFVGPCVTVFGSSRIKRDDPHYELARKMGAATARLGFTVMTGGGPYGHTETVVMQIYTSGFRKLDVGFASALSYVLLAATLLLSVIQFVFFGKREREGD